MRHLALTAALLANAILLASCTFLSPLAAPTPPTQQPLATSVTETVETTADSTAAITPTPHPVTHTATLLWQPPLGLALSNPATLYTAVEHPQMTITLVGLELPAGFPSVTPDPGYRFVAPQLSFFCHLPADSYCRGIGSFELIDSQGTRHSPDVAVSGEGFLSTEAFPGGTAITGGMVFMVPSDAAPLILRYVGFHGREAFFRIE